MKKKTVFLAICFLFGALLSLNIPAFASSTAGTASDPLVAKSWVDATIEERFAPLEAKVATLRSDIYAYYGISEVDILLKINNPVATVNGAEKQIDSENNKVVPYINADNRTMVPVRFIAESIGAEVEWEPNAKMIRISYGSLSIHMTVGKTSYLLDGETRTMDTAPVIHADWGRTMVPVRFVSEAFGCEVDWQPKDNRTETVSVSR